MDKITLFSDSVSQSVKLCHIFHLDPYGEGSAFYCSFPIPTVIQLHTGYIVIMKSLWITAFMLSTAINTTPVPVGSGELTSSYKFLASSLGLLWYQNISIPGLQAPLSSAFMS